VWIFLSASELELSMPSTARRCLLASVRVVGDSICAVDNGVVDVARANPCEPADYPPDTEP